ncbi:MAG: prenyltransferase/squalene oxidase repeat-containing protein [Pirellulaceae bacterium]
MEYARLTTRRRLAWIPVLLTMAVALLSHNVHAYDPDSPEVLAMTNKAVAFLERYGRHEEPGGQALIGMALYKAGKQKDHPVIQQSVAAARRMAAAVGQKGDVGETCYNAAICSIFLCEMDPVAYKNEIEILLRGVLMRQLQTGAWSYNPKSYDDTSQSQYGALCLWAAHHNGIKIPAEPVERALAFFMQSQDQSGGWTYRRNPPVTPGMTAAGLGSAYICAHLLGMSEAVEQQKKEDSGVPSALKVVGEEAERAKKVPPLKPTRTNFSAVRNCVQRGSNWFAQNGFDFEKERWKMYYIYGLERCMSYKEIVEGNVQHEPAWYNEGVEFLRKTQAANGSWSVATGAPAGTAFGILFLMRSTKKSIQKAEKGRVTGNKGLPKDLTQIRVDGRGKVVDEKEIPPIDNLLALLEDEGGVQGDYIDGMPNELELASDPQVRATQLARLRRLALTGSFQARLTAVNTIGRVRDLDNVPMLIYALSDGAWQVAKGGRDGLRFISRKFDGFGMPEKPKRPQYLDAQKKWKEWYLSIRPDGEFIE